MSADTPLDPAQDLRALLRAGRYDDVVRSILAAGDAARGVDYQKCLCDGYAQMRRWTEAIAVATRQLGTDPYFSARLLASLTLNAAQYDACAEWIEEAIREQGETIDILITSSKLAVARAEPRTAKVLGNRILRAKDRQYSTPSTLKIAPGSRKIAAFSLFGDNPVYTHGAVLNAAIWAELAPDWSVRVYTAPDVPDQITAALRDLGAEVVAHNDPGIPHYMSRFLVLQDPDCARFVCRDTDGRPTGAEMAILRDWERSSKRFHIVRNGLLHTDLILAGLWGGTPLAGFDLGAEIRACFPHGASNKYGLDQYFLERRVWGHVRRSLLVHDPNFRNQGFVCRRFDDPALGKGHVDRGTISRDLAARGIVLD